MNENIKLKLDRITKEHLAGGRPVYEGKPFPGMLDSLLNTLKMV